MSPQSRGRRRKPTRTPRTRAAESHRPSRVSTLMLKDLRKVEAADAAVTAESWASTYLGAAWYRSGLGDDLAETTMGLEVVASVIDRPSPGGLAAISAIRRIASPDDWDHLDAAIAALFQTFPPPHWAAVPPATPLSAWRTDDVWLSSKALFVDYDDDSGKGHTLMLQATTPGGVMAGVLDILPRDAVATWDGLVDQRSGVMPLSPAPVDEVLAEIADVMATTDAYWPRYASDEYTAFRALFWSRCRDHLTAHTAQRPDLDRAPLLSAFADVPAVKHLAPEVVASLAALFLDFGEGHIEAGPLAWSPGHVSAVLNDWLPRVTLDPDQRRDLPEVLHAWVRFALEHRGLEERWILPVEEAVDECLPDFDEAFEDEHSWGPARMVAEELRSRGIDLTDPDSVEEGIRAYNAERIARSLLEP